MEPTASPYRYLAEMSISAFAFGAQHPKHRIQGQGDKCECTKHGYPVVYCEQMPEPNSLV